MTLILTIATEAFGMQVSDRLVSRSGETWDPKANKAIVAGARDGHFAISYTGIAYIAREPTDTWIARQLSTLLGYSQRRDDILDDCQTALSAITHEWAVQCREAAGALRAGFGAAAQSHASNIIDSIVLGLLGKRGRDRAKESAQEDFDDQPLQLAAENLTIRPLFRAFTTWWPDTGEDPPEYFARHATCHAVGHVGVFAPLSALVAVMLATSLTAQYAPADSADPPNDGS